MPTHCWPKDKPFVTREIEPDEFCPVCATPGLAFCAKRERDIETFESPMHLVCKLAHCSNPACATRGHTLSPSAEMLIAPPRLAIGWEVFAWIGHRRFARDWRVPQLREELADGWRIVFSDDSIERYIALYQTMLAAREQDPAALARQYRDSSGLVLSIDGLQPEKGHETLYVVREVTQKRVWFASPLLSSAAPEVARLLLLARDWAGRLGKPVLAWVSDKQDAFVSGIAGLFPGVPHRYCANHFLRDAAKLALEQDSRAKVRMRRKVRGLRDIERAILVDRVDAPAAKVLPAPAAAPLPTPPAAAPLPSPPAAVPLPSPPAATPLETPPAAAPLPPEPDSQPSRPSAAGTAVLDYCAAVRGILNNDQGGPLLPPGVRMAGALQEVRASIDRVVEACRPTAERALLERLGGCIDRGLRASEHDLAAVRGHADILGQIQACLDTNHGPAALREAWFDALGAELRCEPDPIRQHMGSVMRSFAPGLFVGPDAAGLPLDNLDLERAFRHPKQHRRHIHGRGHAGIGIVLEGPSLLLALDAHKRHPDRFSPEELAPWCKARPPPCQRDALRRRAIMRKARSPKKRVALLQDLERRSLATMGSG